MNFNLNLFITPVIALGLVLLAYFYSRKRVESHPAYHKYLILVGSLAFFFNWAWEVTQGPLYAGFKFDLAHISFCGLASVADMLMVYALLFGFGLIYKDVFWIKKLTIRGVLWLMLAGWLGAILAEIRHTSAGNWAYADAMPLLPWVDAGLLPVLQFTLLPTIIFFLTKKIVKFDTLKQSK
ncbi:hypothetical protein G3O08_09910 [Cryomorpha ignava]|uniref:Uncharacterized protein n=1 Tax=Cryomorpha ignava TaxID=101383 RepID=A0A7K3WT28_9FLAO|nr:hypothetical protein [Cryomorpha ignava]NEN23815.1 hypothetical protein [Cryomorpha ignava]